MHTDVRTRAAFLAALVVMVLTLLVMASHLDPGAPEVSPASASAEH